MNPAVRTLLHQRENHTAWVSIGELHAALADPPTTVRDLLARILGTHEFPAKHGEDAKTCAICIYARAALETVPA